MHDIFISYAREDAKQAERLAKAFERKGWGVWWDRSLLAGDSFERVIRENLESARCVIVLWSKHSIGSDWVRGEARLGNSRGVLVPVLIDDTVKDIDIPIEFQGFHTERLTKWKGDVKDPEYRRLTEAVTRTGARPTGGQAQVVGLPRRFNLRRVILAVGAVGVAVAALWWTGRLDAVLVTLRGFGSRGGDVAITWDVRLPDATPVGNPVAIEIFSKDATGEPAKVDPEKLVVRVTGANRSRVPTRYAEGVYVARYTAANVGSDTISVFLDGVRVSTGLLVMHVKADEPSESGPSTGPSTPGFGSIVLTTRSPAILFVDGMQIRTIRGQETVRIRAGRDVKLRLEWTLDANGDGRPDCTPWDTTVSVRNGQTVNRDRVFFQCSE